MKKLSYFRPSYLLLGAASLGTFVAISCSTKDTVQPAPATTTTATAQAYSGEALFQGIFMVQGPVADRIPYLAQQRLAIAKESRQYAQERQAAMHQVTALVGKLDPGYFADLAAAVASQNFSRIETALRKGVALHYSAVQQAAPRQLAGQPAGPGLDLTAYDFSKQADLERYLKDSTPATAQKGELEQPLIIDGYVVQFDGIMYPGPYIIGGFTAVNNKQVNPELAEALQKRASLEMDKLVRDIAFLDGRAN